MTRESFLAFYPAFGNLFPDVVYDAYIAAANARFSDFAEDAEEARRLYLAHKLTLYAKTAPEETGGETAAVSLSDLSSAGDGTRIASKRVENVSISYSAGLAASSGSSLWAELSETLYGVQLLAMLKSRSYPRYVP